MTSARSSTSEGDVDMEMSRIKEMNGQAGDVENTGDLRYKKQRSGEGWKIETDAVFGKITEEGPNYKAVGPSSPSSPNYRYLLHVLHDEYPTKVAYISSDGKVQRCSW